MTYFYVPFRTVGEYADHLRMFNLDEYIGADNLARELRELKWARIEYAVLNGLPVEPITFDDDNSGLRGQSRMSFRLSERSSIDVIKRTVDAIITTETPVMMPDFKRMEMVPEVLLASGAVFPQNGQVPLLDSHQRNSLENQLGSVRGLAIEGTTVVGTLHFASVAADQWSKVAEEHTTDVSAGYQVLEKHYIAKGETKTVAGRSFTGPVNVVSLWRLREVSLVPIGADTNAKLRELADELSTAA